jgi:hypothetical protein
VSYSLDGDVPLFAEHCEAVAAKVEVMLRWLGEQGHRELRFSFDVLLERHGALVVACAPSVGGSPCAIVPCAGRGFVTRAEPRLAPNISLGQKRRKSCEHI